MLVLGFAVPMLVTHFAIRRFQGLLVHANVDIRLGPLEWIVSTPHFHHWHHADQQGARNKNYAGQASGGLGIRNALPSGWLARALRLRRVCARRGLPGAARRALAPRSQHQSRIIQRLAGRAAAREVADVAETIGVATSAVGGCV
jgi:hypothetical protein